MIDWDFETRLIERIAARELIRARLNSRQRRVMARYYRLGETCKEVGRHEGISSARVAQIVNGALRRLIAAPVDKLAPSAPTLRAIPPPGFDNAEFLRHMRWLIAERAAEARKAFARERAALDDLIAGEQPPPKPIPWTIAQQQPLLPPPPSLWVYPPKPPQVQAVEPWFDPAQMPTAEGMREIALYAVNFFVAMRRSFVGQMPSGLQRLGTMARSITCRRDADAIGLALGGFARELSPKAHLSACPLAVPAGVLGTTVAAYVGLRVIAVGDGQTVEIVVTWDPA